MGWTAEILTTAIPSRFCSDSEIRQRFLILRIHLGENHIFRSMALSAWSVAELPNRCPPGVLPGRH